MEDFWTYFHCVMSGHPMKITHLEMIGGTLWPVRETCRCGSRGLPIMPGGLFKAWRDHYDTLPPEWPPIYGEDTQ